MNSNVGLYKRALQYRSRRGRRAPSRVKISSTPLPFPPHSALTHSEARDIRSRLRLRIRVGGAVPNRRVGRGDGAQGGWLPALMLTVSLVAVFAAGEVAVEAIRGERLPAASPEDSFLVSARRELESELWERNASIADLRRRLESRLQSGSMPGEGGKPDTDAVASSGGQQTGRTQGLRAELASLIAQRDLAYAVGRRRLHSLAGQSAGSTDGGRSLVYTAGSTLSQFSGRARRLKLADRAVAGFYETVIRRLRRRDIYRAADSLERLADYLDGRSAVERNPRRIEVEQFVLSEVRGPVLVAARTPRVDYLALATRTASMVELRDAVFRGDLLLQRGRFGDARRAYRRALATLAEARLRANDSYPGQAHSDAIGGSGIGIRGEGAAHEVAVGSDEAARHFRIDLEERVTWLNRIEEERTALEETIASLRREVDHIEESLAGNRVTAMPSAGADLPDLGATAIGLQRRRLERVIERYRALLDASLTASRRQSVPAGSLGGE